MSKYPPAARRAPIAVIGVGCRFPGNANTPAELWRNLLLSVDGIVPVPPDRWHANVFHDPDSGRAGRMRSAVGGFIRGIDEFDAEFFGYFPAEASRLDPQQRLLLEVAHEAMEDAGLRAEDLSGSRTAVYIGAFLYDYLCMQTESVQRNQLSPYVAMGAGLCSLSNRISYDFNLKGPSVTLDTACSASLTAIHHACRSIWDGDAELAIAGGVNALLRPESSIMMSRAGFLSPDGRCKAFDASGNGYVRSEGAGLVVLKPLRLALRDRDGIYALIRGSACNQDGYVAAGFTVPNYDSQRAMLESAYRDAGVDPASVAFVEAHGPGTQAGDPIEAGAIGSVLAPGRAAGEELLLGSIKTNIGHLEGASGVAGFIKACLTVRHRTVAPNLHFNTPNPKIDFEGLRLRVPTEVTPLNGKGKRIYAGVNSFGAGGTNVHIVLEEPPGIDPRSTADEAAAPGTVVPVVLSARSQAALADSARTWAQYLRETPHSLEGIALAAGTRRSVYNHGLVAVGATKDEVAARLETFGSAKSTVVSVTREKRADAKLAFIFSGQGGQWAGMGRTLWGTDAVFRSTLEGIDREFIRLAGWSVVELMFQTEDPKRIHSTTAVQPAIMAVQIGLVEMLKARGIVPAGVAGHSIGEVAAAYAAGALTLDQATFVIYHRSRIQARQAGTGGMLAAGLSAEEGRQLVALVEQSAGGCISVAAINGPQLIALAGDFNALETARSILEERGVFHRRINVEVPYHSAFMTPLADELNAYLGTVWPASATVPLYSTVTARQEDGTHLGGDYWYRNVRDTVRFTETMAAMLDDGFNVFLEVGPHPVLVGGAKALIEQGEDPATVFASMRRNEPEGAVFAEALGHLHLCGTSVNWTTVLGGLRSWARDVPKHPWRRQRHWFEVPRAQARRLGEGQANPFVKDAVPLAAADSVAVVEIDADAGVLPWLEDHRVEGSIVVPATAHLEMASAAASVLRPHQPVFLQDLRFESALVLPEPGQPNQEVRLEVLSPDGDYAISSRAPGDGSLWRRHSQGRLNLSGDAFPSNAPSLDAIRTRFGDADELSVESFYATIQAAGLGYGPAFQCVRRLWHRGHEVLAELRLPEGLRHEAGRFHFHPALLDACIHAVFADVHQNGIRNAIYLPNTVDRLKVADSVGSDSVWAYLRISRNDADFLDTDVWAYREDGTLAAELLGVSNRRLRTANAEAQSAGHVYVWREATVEDELRLPDNELRNVFIIGKPDGLAGRLAARLEAKAIHAEVLDHKDSWWERATASGADRRTHLVCLWPLEEAAAGPPSQDELPRRAEDLGESVLALGRALAESRLQPRVYLATGRACSVAGETVDLSQPVVWGMARVIRNECPNVPLKLIDVRPADGSLLDSLVAEITHWRVDLDEVELAWRYGQRLVRELRELSEPESDALGETVLPAMGQHYRLDAVERGLIDSLRFRRQSPQPCETGEVEIEVEASALNFKDVMNAMGLLNARAVSGGLAGAELGLEVAGRVVAIGSNVTQFKIGDDVVARVAHGFAGRVRARVTAVARKPACLTFAEAAAVPVVGLTAYYGLCELGRMAAGEVVLIHSAAGGVGLAAIHLARSVGAAVIATAGTKAKRDYLKSLGIEHVFDSRSLAFHDEVMAATGGRGVDLVLNSLSGPALYASLRCLAPFGRFIEIGKTDIYNNGKLPMERLGENISYHVVDVDRLAAAKPALHQSLLEKVVALHEQQQLPPPEVTTLPLSKVTEAMKLMTRSQHTGKIVLTTAGDHVRTLPPRQVDCRADRAYLITGGASGFGIQLARWLAERGAGGLVLVSRGGPKTESDRAAIDELRARGVAVQVANVDVSDKTAVAKLLDEWSADMPPLGGIIHGAAVLDDALLPGMTAARFRRVFEPKAIGAWNLHRATSERGLDLDFFVMLSSISAVMGLYGQSNYAAANYFLDSLAELRHTEGLPATSINLGVLGDYAGMSRRDSANASVLDLLDSHGLSAMRLGELLTRMGAAIGHGGPQRMLADVDWTRFRRAYPHLEKDSRFAGMFAARKDSRNRTGEGLAGTLAALDPSARPAALGEQLAAAISRFLGASSETLPLDTELESLGLDSLILTQVQNWIFRNVGVNYPMMKLLKGASLWRLAEELVGLIGSGATDDASAAGAASETEADSGADQPEWAIVNPWLVRGHGAEAAPARLICFHSMGVGASLFTRFLVNPPKDLEVLAVQLPGRENRRGEKVPARVDEIVDALLPALGPWLDKPFVVWGHSFGGIIAWEVIRRLRALNGPQPFHVVVSGTIAPHLIPIWQRRDVMVRAMNSENTADYLISLARYVDDPEFIKRIIGLMRADYPLLQSYRYQPDEPLSCPITAFSALQDDMVYPDETAMWRNYTTARFDFHQVDGDHWFLNRHRDRIAAELTAIVRSCWNVRVERQREQAA
jgi:acyl transferase domain-containing protein/NADPH:quinone reductase-like Zn-dependent oxidoreductase/surfactin synthase thioesterase subunit/NAD(P)-dependent dehydrogenase (short-subunit alcohol dehydrogenase family)